MRLESRLKDETRRLQSQFEEFQSLVSEIEVRFLEPAAVFMILLITATLSSWRLFHHVENMTIAMNFGIYSPAIF